jgi:hypothetical protein
VPEEFRMFNLLGDARDYIKSKVGLGPIVVGDSEIASRDRSVTILVTGWSVEELLR